MGANAYAFAGNNPVGASAASAVAPALEPGLYAGAGVYEAAKAGGEKKASKGKSGRSKPQKAKWWQYFTKGWKNFKSPWFVKGKNGRPPYKLGKEAREALNLPRKNKATNVQPYKPNKIVGPRTPIAKPNWGWPNKGKGKEYYDGDIFPE